MANSVPFRTTPQLGMQLNAVNANYWDLRGETFANSSTAPTTSDVIDISSKLGTVEFGNDGREYYLVKASADISGTATTGTQVVITMPGYTVEAGSGGFYTAPDTAYKNGDYFWVSRGARNAVPA